MAGKKPSRPKRITKRQLQHAYAVSLLGESTPETEEVLRRHNDNPGEVLGMSEKEYNSALKTSELIHAPDANQELLLVARALIHCGLPYRAPRDSEGKPAVQYKRTVRTPKGNITLIIAPRDQDIPLPFGKDRAVLAWLQTKAKQFCNPKIRWEYASEFFKAFNLKEGGRTYQEFKESWRRLSNAVFTLEFDTEERDAGEAMLLFHTWDIPKKTNKSNVKAQAQAQAQVQEARKQFGYSVVLSTDLYKHLQESAVPLRLEVMRHFHNEPKAWDMVSLISYFSWVAENMRDHKHPTHTITLTREELLARLGTQDKDTARMLHTMRTVIDRLKTIWPEVQVELKHGGELVVSPPIGGKQLVEGRGFKAIQAPLGSGSGW